MSNPSENPPKIDVAEILDTKVVQKTYADAVAPSSKEIGKIGKDVLRGLRLFTAPFRLMGELSERLDRMLSEVRRRVPKERQVQSPANVAGPSFEKLRYIEDGSVLQEMFLNLLTASIDKSRQRDAHPAYPDIIGSLADEEAFFLYDLAQVPIIDQKFYKDEHPNVDSIDFEPTETAILQRLPQWRHLGKHLMYSYLDHCESLGVIKQSEAGYSEAHTNRSHWQVWVGITHFGEHFVKVCFPDKSRVDAVRNKTAEPVKTKAKAQSKRKQTH